MNKVGLCSVHTAAMLLLLSGTTVGAIVPSVSPMAAPLRPPQQPTYPIQTKPKNRAQRRRGGRGRRG